MKKFYEGVAGLDGRPNKVFVRLAPGPEKELKHHVHHSPSGFAWGYFGSGPAELSRCLLWDFLGCEPHHALYQKFKEDYVAHWKIDESWLLSSEAIESWLSLNSGTPREAPLPRGAPEENTNIGAED